MSQYNKLSNIQYVIFQILPVVLHFGLFWSTGIPTMKLSLCDNHCVSPTVGSSILFHINISNAQKTINIEIYRYYMNQLIFR